MDQRRLSQAARSANARLRTLLRAHSSVLPSYVFAELFGVSGSLVRQHRADLNASHFAHRDSFSRSTKLPALGCMNEAEQSRVRELWKSAKVEYGRSQRSRRMRAVIVHCSKILPTIAIARLFAVSERAVIEHMRNLELSLPRGAGNRLRNKFLNAENLPELPAAITPEERCKLETIRQEVRKAAGRNDVDQEQQLLEDLASCVPLKVLARFFKVSDSCIRKRCADSGIILELQGIVETNRFLDADIAPRFEFLETRKQQQLVRAWLDLKAERKKRRDEMFREREEKLLSRLRAALPKKTGKLHKCCGAGCKHAWPRTAEFFNRNRYTRDGYESHCKVCAYRRNHTVSIARRKPALRVVTGLERKRLAALIKQNAKLIPSRLIMSFCNVNAKQLMYLRREAKVKVSPGITRDLYLDWMRAEEMPAVKMTAEDRARLRELWIDEKRGYFEAMEADDGRFELQREDRRRVLAANPNVAQAACHGKYCSGVERWPKTSKFFRKHMHCDPKDRRCYACANYEARLAKFSNSA